RNNSDVRPLSETDDFRRVAEIVPSNSMMITFSRPADQYRPLYEMLRGGNAAENFPGMDQIISRIDFTTLPAFSTIEKYMSPTGGYWVTDDKGALGVQFSLKPKQ
ncbi:MAG: hypothetical protein KDA85_05520, partial [Planctomycetaceae bacterium]|nr:hypothetical protein [Planctomycetaceae bacterium]